jgi:glycine oxidase
MSRTDVIILGGGIIGCALAEELARRGTRVAVLERGTIGAEASGAAAGILCSQGDLAGPDALFEMCQQARRLYPRWIARLQRRSGVRVDYTQRGVLHLVTTRRAEQAMLRRARWQRRLGLRVERWSPSQVRRHEPQLDGSYVRGFYMPEEAEVDNALLMRALAQACRASGVDVRERESVTNIVVHRQAVRGVKTDQASYDAPIVVNCLGSWASMGGAFPIRLQVAPARGQILVFQGPKGMFRRPMMSDRGYLIQRRDGRVLVGSTVEIGQGRRALTYEGIRSILCGVQHLTSALDACVFVDAWAGLRPYSGTGHPLMGQTIIEGLYVATGHFRHGILLAPITATIMADLILHRRSCLDLAPFSPARFNT